MRYVKREKSVVTGKKSLEHLYTIKEFPVYMGCVSGSNSSNDLSADMSISICKESGIIQLDKVLPLEIVYLHQHNDGVGKTWEGHYKEFSKFIHKFNPKQILEIGGGNGVVAKAYLKNKKKAHWTMVEPNPTIKSSSTVSVIKDWYSNEFKTPSSIDAIVHSHVFEHVYDPWALMEKISSDLAFGGKQIFSVPNFYELLEKKYTNALNFEHTIFLSEYFVDYFLVNSGFRIVDKKRYLNHSIFYAAEKVERRQKIEYISKYIEYKALFKKFIKYQEELVIAINKQISEIDCNVYLFGAHIFSQYLISMGLDTRKISGILDNSDIKEGKRLYGTSLKVYKPGLIKKLDRVAVVIKAAGYQSEIKSQILNLNQNVTVIE